MEFQEQLYRLRKQAGLSQGELSHIIGVSRQAVQKWEAGSARPDLDNLIALASHFKLSLDQLVGLTENHSSPISFAQNGYYSPSKTSNSIYFIPCRWHYEYKSKCTLWGVPVLHIHFADRGLARATGIFAIGNSSFGLVSLGGISVGLFSLGGLSLGMLSFGGIALGAMAWGIGCLWRAGRRKCGHGRLCGGRCCHRLQGCWRYRLFTGRGYPRNCSGMERILSCRSGQGLWLSAAVLYFVSCETLLGAVKKCGHKTTLFYSFKPCRHCPKR